MAEMTVEEIKAAMSKVHSEAEQINSLSEAQDAVRTISKAIYHLARKLDALAETVAERCPPADGK